MTWIRGYTESDVRQQARALTGFRNDWRSGVGNVNFRYDAARHDTRMKTVFRKRGAFTWKDAVRLSVTDPDRPQFFIRKLWSSFVAGELDAPTQRSLEQLYVRSGHDVRPVVAAILKHPALYGGGRIVKPAGVYTPGLLRRIGRPIDTTSGSWIGSVSRAEVFFPPEVPGWGGTRLAATP